MRMNRNLWIIGLIGLMGAVWASAQPMPPGQRGYGPQPTPDHALT